MVDYKQSSRGCSDSQHLFFTTDIMHPNKQTDRHDIKWHPALPEMLHLHEGHVMLCFCMKARNKFYHLKLPSIHRELLEMLWCKTMGSLGQGHPQTPTYLHHPMSTDSHTNYTHRLIDSPRLLHSRWLMAIHPPGLNWILTPASFWIFLIISPFLPITMPTANLGTATWKGPGNVTTAPD